VAPVVVVVAASLCCAHAPKLRAPAKTAMIMIALMNFNLVSPPFGCVSPVVLGVEHPRSNAYLDVLPYKLFADDHLRGFIN